MAWSVVAAKSKLSEILKRASKEPQVIESRGEPVAVVLSAQEYQAMLYRLEKSESPMQRMLQAAQDVRKEPIAKELKLPKRTDRAVSKVGE